LLPLTVPKLAKSSLSINTTSTLTLSWPCRLPFTLTDAELSLIPVLLRWKENERGMMKDQPSFRLPKIKKACKKVNVPLSQALSLRRHHIQQMSSYRRQCCLGDEQDIRDSAALFETAIGLYLNQQSVPYVTEAMQKQQHLETNRKSSDDGEPVKQQAPTPDFLLSVPIQIVHHNQVTNNNDHEHAISWIEAKHFYGASTIPQDNKSAVGRIIKTAQRYRDLYGPGAMVFAYGVSDKLARELAQVGVLALDSGPADMGPVVDHLQTWCADKNGVILP